MSTDDGSLDPTLAPPTRPSNPGSGEHGDTPYELGAVLGRGGMGEVVLAKDTKIGRAVALKRLRGDNPSPDAVARFLREARIQARLDHPAIVPVHEVGEDTNGHPYFTMKRLAGTTLADALEARQLSLQKLLRAFVEVSLAIELAHARGVVHRDLKPANIVLGDYGEVYVLDWGVARVIGDLDPATAEGIDSLGEDTQVGTLLGTPGYMAPEQVQGGEVGPPADVYALGAILFEILTDNRLHPAGAAALLTTAEASIERSPAKRYPDASIAPELDAACVAALASDPATRPTARALATRIESYLDGDRDLEQRRKLSAEQLAIARAAFAAGDRATAVQAAGRAFTFDQTSQPAADLLTSLIVAPPDHVPAEVEREVDGQERQLARLRSRRAVIAYLGFFAFAPVVAWLGVASVMALFAIVGVVLATIATSLVNWRVRYVPTTVFLAIHLGTAVAFSRFASPFVLTPILIAGILLAITNLPGVLRHHWLVAVWTLVAATLPFVLERVGVLAPTWELDPQRGLISWGTVFTHHEKWTLIAADVCFCMTVALYALGINRDRRDAQRKMFVQAWHLRQLLPRRTIAE